MDSKNGRWMVVRFIAAVILSAAFAYGGNIVCRNLMAQIWGGEAAIPGNAERMGILFFVFLFVFLHFVVKPRALYAQLFRFRWLLGALLFAACVLAGFHGSSLGVWNLWIQPGAPYIDGSVPVFGTIRPERTDEFVVNTPLAFSQAFTGYAPVNSIAQAWPTNMLTIYNQPVLDPTLIAKPFYWGYVLLGTAKGLSWFWCGRFIALFLVSFEMFRVLTKDKRLWSLTGAFLLAFAPVVQWWFSVNFLVEMLVFGQLAVLSAYYFLRTQRFPKKFVWTVVFALSVCAYLFSLYPAWMVPLAYLFAVLFIWVVAANFRAAPRYRAEWLHVLLAVILIGGLMAYWYFESKGAIEIIRGTVYPGQRQTAGGGAFGNLFNYWLNFRMPYLRTGSWAGGAIFPGFFPFGEILAVALLIRTKLKDKLLFALLCVNAFLILYAAAGFPMPLAKATLLSYSQPWAVAIASTGVSVFLLIRSLSAWSGIAAAPVKSGAGVPAFLKTRALPVLLPVILIAFVVISGASVNPLMRGISAVTQKPLYAEVQKLQAEDPGVWITTYPSGNYTILAGAPTINSTNIIPALGRWQILDPDGKYRDTYNRYAHVVIGFNNDKTTFGPGGEIIGIDLAMKDLRKLNVKYICLNSFGDYPQESLPALSWDGGRATEIYNEYQICIYKVEYDA